MSADNGTARDAVSPREHTMGTDEKRSSAQSTLDFDQMRERLGDDEELISDVIRLFLEDYPLRLAAIKSALEARDPERLRAAAHTLKGSASNLSAPGVVAAARALEAIGSSGDLGAAEAGFARLVSEAERLEVALREIQATRS